MRTCAIKIELSHQFFVLAKLSTTNGGILIIIIASIYGKTYLAVNQDAMFQPIRYHIRNGWEPSNILSFHFSC